MIKPAFLFCIVIVIAMCGCEKSNCETYLTGSWTATHQQDTTLAQDSVIFYKGDSIEEIYKVHTDTFYHYYYSSYYINDQCSEIDFYGTNTWSRLSTTVKYNVQEVAGHDFRFISQGDSNGCTACVVSLHK